MYDFFSTKICFYKHTCLLFCDICRKISYKKNINKFLYLQLFLPLRRKNRSYLSVASRVRARDSFRFSTSAEGRGSISFPPCHPPSTRDILPLDPKCFGFCSSPPYRQFKPTFAQDASRPRVAAANALRARLTSFPLRFTPWTLTRLALCGVWSSAVMVRCVLRFATHTPPTTAFVHWCSSR